jgi:hypothetical protein
MEEKRERREKEKEEVEKKNSLFLSFFFGLFSLWLLFSFSRRRKKKKREQVRRGKKKERERASSRRLAGGDNGRSQSAARGLEGCARSPLVPEEGGHVDVRGAWGRGGRERERVRKNDRRAFSFHPRRRRRRRLLPPVVPPLFSKPLSPFSFQNTRNNSHARFHAQQPNQANDYAARLPDFARRLEACLLRQAPTRVGLRRREGGEFFTERRV